jgi:hypothetical protein
LTPPRLIGNHVVEIGQGSGDAVSAFGSQFTLVLPFTIQGDASGIDSVSVSLVNNQGSSSAVSGKF